MADTRYNVTLSSSLNEDLEKVASDLQISKAEAVRRALLLFKHAAKADKVELVTARGASQERQAVLIK